MYIKEKIVNAPEDEGVILQYRRLTRDFIEIREYCRHKGETITGYTQNHDATNIRVEDILYFEAVGELVFAYLEDQIFEIRGRLYQMEQKLNRKNIMRASKSILINVEKIVSVRSALNGRLMARMENGEEVLISRNYAKQIAAYIMEEDDEGI